MESLTPRHRDHHGRGGRMIVRMKYWGGIFRKRVSEYLLDVTGGPLHCELTAAVNACSGFAKDQASQHCPIG